MIYKDVRDYKTELEYKMRLMCLIQCCFTNIKLYKFI